MQLIILTIWALSIAIVFLVSSSAIAQNSKDPPFADQQYLLAKHYAERVEALERRIEDLTAKCGDRCTPPIPDPPVGNGNQK